MIKISKIEAARRQLDAAIRLFFADDDWIAIHTLAAASGRILRDLTEQRGSLLFESWHIGPKARRSVWNEVNRVANFFKHADRDYNDLLDGVDPIGNDHLIFINCMLFAGLERRHTTPMTTCYCWYIGAYPENFPEVQIPGLVEIERLAASVNRDLSRAEQLAFCQTMLKAQLASGAPGEGNVDG